MYIIPSYYLPLIPIYDIVFLIQTKWPPQIKNKAVFDDSFNLL